MLLFLKKSISISRKSLTSLKFRDDGITVNGKHVTVRYILQSGDILSIADTDTEENASRNIPPSGILPDIIYEDGNILALKKPPYMPTHPSHGHNEDTLANTVAELYKRRNIPFVFRPIGRLDRNTSGVVLCAKTKPASAYLTSAVRDGRFQKTYIAILSGELPDGEDLREIRRGIKRAADSIIMRVVCDAPEGSPDFALTYYRVLAVSRDRSMTLVQAMPATGRTHQLRVHFASIGHHILGDDLYGQSSELIGRHALHAQKLSIPLPFGGEQMILTAPLPDDMNNIINTFFDKVNINA